MVVPSDTVSDEAADDREAGLLDDRLDGMGDVFDMVADSCLLDSRLERVLPDVEQPLRLAVDLADAERVRTVRDVPVQRHAYVDRDEVAFADLVVAGDSVHDDVVRRDADRSGIALVSERGRQPAMSTDEPPRSVVELRGRHARRDERAHVGDRLGHERSGARDLLDLPLALADDHRERTATCVSAASMSAATSPMPRSPGIGTSVPSVR